MTTQEAKTVEEVLHDMANILVPLQLQAASKRSPNPEMTEVLINRLWEQRAKLKTMLEASK